jgi:hypothetical protein
MLNDKSVCVVVDDDSKEDEDEEGAVAIEYEGDEEDAENDEEDEGTHDPAKLSESLSELSASGSSLS